MGEGMGEEGLVGLRSTLGCCVSLGYLQYMEDPSTALWTQLVSNKWESYPPPPRPIPPPRPLLWPRGQEGTVESPRCAPSMLEKPGGEDEGHFQVLGPRASICTPFPDHPAQPPTGSLREPFILSPESCFLRLHPDLILPAKNEQSLLCDLPTCPHPHGPEQ